MFSLLLAIIYFAFISLGLPDALLGSAWPTMYREFSVPVSYAGGIAMIIAAGTIVSSLQSDRLTRRFGTGKVTAISAGLDGNCFIRFFNESFLLDALFVGHPVRTRCRWSGRVIETITSLCIIPAGI